MMRRIKAWALVTAGALSVLLGIISVVNFSFDWEFIMPPTIVLAGVLILAGGTVFAQGLLSLESPPKTSNGEGARQQRGSGNS